MRRFLSRLMVTLFPPEQPSLTTPASLHFFGIPEDSIMSEARTPQEFHSELKWERENG